jgi:predicted small lipoprotein YifL
MRKLFTLLVVVSLSWSVAGCGGPESTVDPSSEAEVETEISDQEGAIEGGEIQIDGVEGMAVPPGEGGEGGDPAPPA